MVSISELYPYKGVDQTIALTPIELALCLYAMETIVADGVDIDDIDDMQALIDYVIGVLQIGGTATMSTMPVGAILAMGTTALPSNWLACNGDAVSRATYAALFSAIGTTYGIGNGTTTFNIPDLKGRVPMGNGINGSDFDKIMGVKWGAERVSIGVNEMPAHSHQIALQAGTTGTTLVPPRGQATFAGMGATQSTGAGDGHANLQPSLVVAYAIYAGT